MKNDRLFYLSTIFLCAVFFQASAASGQIATATASAPAIDKNASAASSRTPVAEENLIHSGDLIDVDVIGSTEYDWRGTLSPEGFLNGINFTENPIYALCRTEESVAGEVAKSYSRILRAPQVEVKILDRSARPVTAIFGAVRKVQRFQIRRPILLNELIVISGGFTDKASGEIQIFRPPSLNCLNEITKQPDAKNEQSDLSNQTGEPQYFNIKISDLLAGKTNPQIFSGDVVTILEAKPIYVIGAVGVPKQIATRAEITLSRAVTSAGGLLKNADATQITIFRHGDAATGGETKTIQANLDKIKAGQEEDIILQAFDVVEVTQTGREKRKFPPVLKMDESSTKAARSLPLRIVE